MNILFFTMPISGAPYVRQSCNRSNFVWEKIWILLEILLIVKLEKRGQIIFVETFFYPAQMHLRGCFSSILNIFTYYGGWRCVEKGRSIMRTTQGRAYFSNVTRVFQRGRKRVFNSHDSLKNIWVAIRGFKIRWDCRNRLECRAEKVSWWKVRQRYRKARLSRNPDVLNVCYHHQLSSLVVQRCTRETFS